MKQMEPKQKDKYEPPEVRDIAPVTIVNGDEIVGSGAGDEYDNPYFD